MKSHSWLLENLPHQGSMNLLDTVLSWDADQIHCSASSHLDPNNPLAENGLLGTSAGIEYAAQAMAAHGRLTAPATTTPRQGYIAGIRDIRFYVQTLNNASPTINIQATRLMGDDDNVIYQFTISDQGINLVTGRATVVLDRNKNISL
ncbi:MAG: hypothetical protein RL651_1263 [Pseudomonadota bacterium]|jgi:predicted hotdog family 3-hydroxylacyl-ACP dehydratase